jgi:hypothetical protein
MSVTKEVAMEREKLIEAARLIQSYCVNNRDKYHKCGKDCLFRRKYVHGNSYYCEMDNEPYSWYVPEVQNDEHGQKY